MTIYVTPSSLWQGNPAPGSRWTQEQLTVLAREGVANPEAVDTCVILRRDKSNAENWEMPPKAVEVTLPRLAKARTTGNCLVVTPAGAKEWMRPHHG